jgi:hypothetical protein
MKSLYLDEETIIECHGPGLNLHILSEGLPYAIF